MLADAIGHHLTIGNRANGLVLAPGRDVAAAMPAAVGANGINKIKLFSRVREIHDVHGRVGRVSVGGTREKRRTDKHGPQSSKPMGNGILEAASGALQSQNSEICSGVCGREGCGDCGNVKGLSRGADEGGH